MRKIEHNRTMLDIFFSLGGVLFLSSPTDWSFLCSAGRAGQRMALPIACIVKQRRQKAKPYRIFQVIL